MTGGRRNRTALHYASIANNDAIVKLLLRHNADQEIVDATGYTALNLSNGGEVCRLLHQVKCVYINSHYSEAAQCFFFCIFRSRKIALILN